MKLRKRNIALIGLVAVSALIVVGHGYFFTLIFRLLNFGLGLSFESENFASVAVLTLILAFVICSVAGYIILSAKLISSKKSRFDYLIIAAPLLVIISLPISWLEFNYSLSSMTLFFILSPWILLFLVTPSLYALFRLFQKKSEYLAFFISSVLCVPIQLAVIILFIARFIGW